MDDTKKKYDSEAYKIYYQEHREEILEKHRYRRTKIGDDGMTPSQRYYERHKEAKKARMKEYRERRRLQQQQQEVGDGLTAQQRWRQKHRDEYNARRREQRAEERRTGIARKASGIGKNCAVVTPGRRCTDCSMYLRSMLCSESFFRVVSCGISVAETCVNYDGPEPEPVAVQEEPEPLRIPEPKTEEDRHRLVVLNFIEQ